MSRKRSKTERARQAQAPARPSAPRPAAQPHIPGPWLTAALVLAGAGVLLTAYLSATQWLDTQPAYCAAGSGCDLVQSSRFSVLLGLPLALWGLATYAAIGGFAWRARRRPRAWYPAWLLAALGTALSAYFTAVSVFEIEALCPWCLASAAVMTALLAALSLGRPAQPRVPGFGTAAPAAIAAAAVVGGLLHLHWAGAFDPAAGPEDPYLRGLAEHLEDGGAKFYGAHWCPHCQDQKAVFGAAAKRLPYVECSPGGRQGPRATDCVQADIDSYPTWIIDGRRLEGVLSPKALARASDYRPPPENGVR